MSNISEENAQITFIGEVDNPCPSPPIPRMKDMVSFRVRQLLSRGPLRNSVAQLISETDEIYPITIRGTGSFQPSDAAGGNWQPGDFLLLADGITLEQAQDMRKIVQYAPSEGSDFSGIIIESLPSSNDEIQTLDIRIRPQLDSGLRRESALIVDSTGQQIPVTIYRIMPAPPSPELGRYGDLIATVDGLTLDQARTAKRLTQPARKK
jgi:hypothetical protein